MPDIIDTSDQLDQPVINNSLTDDDLKQLAKLLDNYKKSVDKTRSDEKKQDQEEAKKNEDNVLTVKTLTKILNNYLYTKEEQQKTQQTYLDSSQQNLKLINDNIQSVNNILYIQSIFIVIFLGVFLGHLFIGKFSSR